MASRRSAAFARGFYAGVSFAGALVLAQEKKEEQAELEWLDDLERRHRDEADNRFALGFDACSVF